MYTVAKVQNSHLLTASRRAICGFHILRNELLSAFDIQTPGDFSSLALSNGRLVVGDNEWTVRVYDVVDQERAALVLLACGAMRTQSQGGCFLRGITREILILVRRALYC